MRKNLLMFIFLFSLKGFSQTPPPDSLIGTYAGQYWYANPASDPWIITNDTLYVNSIDTIYCSIYGYNNNINVYGLFQTEYYYCNHQYPNCALKFYSGDSIRIVMDNGIGPATNWIFVSKRFYGKRISHHTYTGVNPNNLNKCIITPNPATHFLTLKIENFELLPFTFQLYDMQGSLQKEGKTSNSQTEINVATLPRGLYILKIITDKQTITKKVVLQ